MREARLIWRRKLGLDDRFGLQGPGVPEVPAGFPEDQQRAFVLACTTLTTTTDPSTRWAQVAALCEIVASIVAGPAVAALLRAAYVGVANETPLRDWRSHLPPSLRPVLRDTTGAVNPHDPVWVHHPGAAGELAEHAFDPGAYAWPPGLHPRGTFEEVALPVLVQNRVNAFNGAPSLRSDTLFEGLLAAWNATHGAPLKTVRVPPLPIHNPILTAFVAGHLDVGCLDEGRIEWLDRDFFLVQEGPATTATRPSISSAAAAGISLTGIVTGWIVGDLTAAAHQAAKGTVKGVLGFENPVRGRKR